MLSNGAESIRKKRIRDYSFAIDASSAAFPTVLADLIADFAISYDVEFRPYLPVRMPENDKSYADIEFDVAENSIAGMITVGRNRLSQTIRTIFKPANWMTWIGTQPLSSICSSWTVEFDGETANPVIRTGVGIATRKSIERFSSAIHYSNVVKFGGCYLHTDKPNCISATDAAGNSSEYNCPQVLQEDWFAGSMFGEAGDQITISVRQTSATESAVSFTTFYADIFQRRSDPDVFVVSTADLANYIPFILTNERVRLLISSSN